ncbi:MAG: antibiotic biosynthesis monooxygenase family protein, partial [Frankia sp.]
MAGPMIRATLHLRVRAGREPEFEAAWRRVAQATRRWPGNLRQALLRTADGGYVITSDWVDRGAFGSFERSDEQDVLTAPIRALRESARMELTEVVVHVDAVDPADAVDMVDRADAVDMVDR